MKKRLILILAFLLAAAAVCAGETSSPWAVNSVILGIGNDKYAYGLSRNDDDQLSYSEHVTIAAERWYLNANLNGITNRGWKKGWDIRDANVPDMNAEDFYHGRLDTTEIRAGLNYTFDFRDLFALTLSPETGFYLSGNTGYDYLQNLIHKIMKIHRVDLPYDYEDVRFHYYLGAGARLFYNICTLKSTKLSLSVTASASYAFGFESNEKIKATLALQNDYSDVLALTFGWNWTQEHNSSSTMELYSRYINGPYAGYKINTGLFMLDYYTELTNHFGYAVISVDAMSFFHPTIWKENNFYLSMGFANMLGTKFQDQELNWPINDNWSVVLKNRYVAGYPTDKSGEFNGNPNVDYRMKVGHAMDTLGIEFSYPIEALRNWVAPYVSLSVGFMRWDLTALTNMLYFASFPSKSWSMRHEGGEGADYSFVADAEAGVTLIPEGLVSFNSTSITLSVFGGLSYVTGDFLKGYRQVTEDNVISWDYSTGWQDHFLFRWGLTINFGFDI